MNSTHTISRNVIATVIQVVVSGLVLFFLYRYLFDELGVEAIGVWSLVLASASISRIGELGLSAGVIKFVAKEQANGRNKEAAEIIQTVVITLGVFMAFVLLCVFPVLKYLISLMLPEHSVDLAIEILPLALVSLWLMVVSSVFMGGLDGCHRIDLRSWSTIIFNIVFFILAVVLVPDYGLKGVAYAQVVQAFGSALLTWLLLRGQLSSLPYVPYTWNRGVLKHVLRYGINFQLISVMSMLLDPVTKGMMSVFGGLTALGFYEMANKLILQFRAIIVESNRVMIPVISSVKEQEPNNVKKIYLKSFEAISYISILYYALIMLSLPLISWVWLGSFELSLIGFSAILAISWFINTMAGPAFMSNLGTGDLAGNMRSQVIVFTVSLMCEFIFGYLFGAYGVVIGIFIGLFLGSVYLIADFNLKIGLAWENIVQSSTLVLLLVVFTLALGVLVFALTVNDFIMVLLCTFLAALLVSVAGWKNNMRSMLIAEIKKI